MCFIASLFIDYICVLYIYTIYIYMQRERERERDLQCQCVSVIYSDTLTPYIYIYIYIYILYIYIYIHIYIYTNVNHLTSLKNTGQFHVVSKRNAPSYAATTRSRSSHQSCLVKNVFLKISQENTSAGVVQGLHHYQRVTPTQVFSCEICDIFKNTFQEKFVNGCFYGSCFPQKCKFQMQSS